MVEDRAKLEAQCESYSLSDGPGDYRGLSFADVKHLEDNWPVVGRAIHDLCVAAQEDSNG